MVVKDNIYQYLAAITGGLLGIVFGTNTAWMSPYLQYLTSNESVIPMTSEESSWIAIAPLIGCSIGAVIVFRLPDNIGRKTSLLCLTPIVFICYVCIGFVRHTWYLFLLRCIIGIADGATYTVLPMYIGEISDPGIRDFLSAITCSFYTLGVIFINIIGPFVSIFTASMICASIPLFQFSSFIFMPESPYYYIMKNRMDEAKRSLTILKGNDNVSKDIDVIREGLAKESGECKSKFIELITIKSNRRATFVFMVLILAARCNGKVAIMIYTKTIFEETGSSIDSSLSAVIYNSIELFVMLSVVLFLVSRFGKRTLILASTVGTIITTFLFALYFQLKDTNLPALQYLQWLPLTLLISYNILYSIGLSFAPYSYMSEMFPSNVKAKATCMAEIVTVLLGAITSKLFQTSFDHFGTMAIPFYCFSAATAFWLLFIIKLVPEIHGKTLQDIQDIFNRRYEDKLNDPKLDC